MRVAFDSAPFRYDPAGSRGPSGVARWSLGALGTLARLAPEWDLLGVAPGFGSPTLAPASIGPSVDYKRIPIPRRFHHTLQLIGIEPPLEMVAGKVDVSLGNAYIPAYSRRAAPVPVIYDLSLVKHPEMHPAKRNAYVGGQLNKVMRRAAMVVTISQCVREEIAEHYGFPIERIAVAPPGCEPAGFPPGLGGTAEVPEDFLLFVGTLEPRKNIAALLAAHAGLVERRPDAPALVLVGGEGWGAASFAGALKAGIAAGRVVAPGYVSDEQLASLYRSARGLVYPSLYEGFGMPIVEAMAAGCPVLTSNVPSTAETAGGAALLVDPADTEAITDGMERLLDDTSLRESLVARGLARSKDFSWERTGAALKEALERAIS